jgi:TetR/AcrR family transcriptional regulator, regulator of cefoperazone and chloramphenicol sensitivity
MPTAHLPHPADFATERRILEAAAVVFADVGYEHATIREVCRRAEANVAAVNYHFESKERLYLETLRWAMRLCHGPDQEELLAFAARADLSREERLLGLVRRFAVTMLGARPEWHTRLLLRELGRPTRGDPTTKAILDEFMAPRFRALAAAIAPFLPAGTDDETLALHAMSVVGQVLYHRIASPAALHFLGREAYDAAFVARVADHVAAFTLAALAAGGAVAPGGEVAP